MNASLLEVKRKRGLILLQEVEESCLHRPFPEKERRHGLAYPLCGRGRYKNLPPNHVEEAWT